MSKSESRRELISNRKAFHNFEILDKFEVGIALVGTEIKSLRQDGGSLQEAYITVDNGELWLINSSIPPYSFGNIHNHEEKRKRKLLAHKKEIFKIGSSIQEKGLTCIPLSMFLKDGIAKLEIGLAKGKKMHDKRAAIKEREDSRSIQRAIRQHM